MKYAKACTLAICVCFAGSLLAGTAAAAPSPATVVTEAQENILWSTASVESSDIGSLEVRVMAPKVAGKKRLVFQKCIFNLQGAGEYRCGIDIAEGSAASKRVGNWMTKVLVNGAVTDRTRFSL